MSDFIFGDLTDWIESVIDALGYAGVAFLVMLENLFPPIPSEVVLPSAGLYAERNGGAAPLVGMIMAATIGSVIGALVLYGIAAWIGRDRLRSFVLRQQRWLRIKERDLDKAEGWFVRHEEAAVLIGRCVPLVRSLVSLPAGFERMGLVRFCVFTAIGSAIWNTGLIMVGYAASSYQDEVESAMGYLQYLVIAALLAAIAWFVWSRFIRPRPADEPSDQAPTDAAAPAADDDLPVA